MEDYFPKLKELTSIHLSKRVNPSLKISTFNFMTYSPKYSCLTRCLTYFAKYIFHHN